MIERNEAKKLVIRAGRELSDSGLIARTWGNVGARVSPYTFVITASGIPYEDLTENDVVEVSMGYARQMKTPRYTRGWFFLSTENAQAAYHFLPLIYKK